MIIWARVVRKHKHRVHLHEWIYKMFRLSLIVTWHVPGYMVKGKTSKQK